MQTPVNNCGRQHAPVGISTSQGFAAQQPDFETKKIVIDYAPGPDSVSKVMRKRTLSMMELSDQDIGRRNGRPPDRPKPSAANRNRGFSIEKPLCKPIPSMKPEGNCEAKPSRSVRKSQCATLQEDDIKTAQQLTMQQGEHRCRRAPPGQDCKPAKPKSKTNMFPQLSLALFPMPTEELKPKCRQAKTEKRADAKSCDSSSFPQFEEAKNKKKLRVSFANDEVDDITAQYTKCDPKWRERLANEAARKSRRPVAEESKPEVNEMQQSRHSGGLGAKAGFSIERPIEMPSRPAKPFTAESVQQKRQLVENDRQESKRTTISEAKLSELQRCLGLYEANYPQEDSTYRDLSEVSPQQEQQHDMESSSYRTPKSWGGTCMDMYKQESSCGSKENQQLEQQCEESPYDDRKLLASSESVQDSGQQQRFLGQIYSGFSHVEFEANKYDDDEDDLDAEQPKKNTAIERQVTDPKRRSSSNVLAELEVSRMEQINPSSTKESQLSKKRDSEDYSFQIGVRESSTAGASFSEHKQSWNKERNTEKPCSKTSDHLCKEDQQQTQPTTQRQSRAEQPSCVGFQPGGGAASQRRRSESEPCMQRDRRMSPCGQKPAVGDTNDQKAWKQEDYSGESQPRATSKYSEKQTETKQPKQSPDMSEACQEALRQDAERRRKREEAERAREKALQEALKPRRPPPPATAPCDDKGSKAAPMCPEVKCHCSLHSEQKCEGGAKSRSVTKPAVGSSGNKKEKSETAGESACSEDISSVEWIQEGHLLVKYTNGKRTGAQVMSKDGSSDIYGGGDQPVKLQSESSEATPKQKTVEEETMEDSSMVQVVSQPNPNDLLWGGIGEGERTMETTDDDPIVAKKKCCC